MDSSVSRHAAFSLLWLAMITSAAGGVWLHDIPISNPGAGGLLRPCVVRTSKIVSVDSRLTRRTGSLAQADHQKFAATLRTLLNPVLVA